MRDFRSWMTSNVIFPFYHLLKGDGLMSAIRAYEKSQWLSEKELSQLQEAKLQKLLQHSARDVPYYRKLFNTYGIDTSVNVDYELFKNLPLLTKMIMRREGENICASSIKKRDLVRNSTSGSTGEPLAFFNDRKSQMWRQAVIWRNQKWLDARYSDKEARLWGAAIDLNKAESIRGRLSAWAHQTELFSTYDLSDSTMHEYAERIQSFSPRLLVSYPSPLVAFALFLEEKSITLPSIKAIVTSAEQLHRSQRDIIERVFGLILFDRYGCREFGNIAHECEMQRGYHINDERFFLEVLDSRGGPVGPGETGEVVITDLDNYGYPFIRYKIGDLAVPSNRQCGCGRGLALIERFEGRSFDIVRCPNGGRVAGTYWTIMLRNFSGIIQFQIVQYVLGQLIIRLRIDAEWEQSSECEITARVKEKCGESMNVRYEYVSNIELTASGKQKLVISAL